MITQSICLAPLLIFSLSPPTSTTVTHPIPTGHSTLLPPKEGLKLANQCSRRGVENISNSWVPSSEQIQEMECNLNNYLKDHYPKISNNIENYYFQYAGYVVNSELIIYINAFPKSLLEELKFSEFPEPPDWRRTAEMVCDGGPSFWGVEYHPTSKKFTHISFNGSA